MKILIHFLKLVWRISPGYVLLLIFGGFLTCGQLLLNVVMPKFLIEELMGSRRPGTLLLLGLVVVLGNVGIAFLNHTVKCVMKEKRSFVVPSMNKIMAEKIMNLEYSCLEDPYYLDLKERAMFAIRNQDAVAQVVTCSSELFSGFLTLAGLVAVIATLGPVLPAVLAVSITLMLLIYASYGKYQRFFTGEIIPLNRKYGYYFQLGFEKEYQKDIRLYQMQNMLHNRVMEEAEAGNRLYIKIARRGGLCLGAMRWVNEAVTAVCYGYVGLRTLSESFGARISIGSLTMYVSAAMNFSNSVVEFGMKMVQTWQCLSFLEPYMEFMGLEEETADRGKEPFTGEIEEISFCHVSFTYPKGQQKVLDDVSFRINRGEKISIVGLNGAGKSTLVKLLCRMYRVDSGEILINGKNIQDYGYKSYMEKIAAVFQDFRLFDFTIGENISCQQEDADRERMNRLVDEVGLREKTDSLKQGLDTRFGKEYEEDGTEMSGGEGQKVAIARALYKEGSLVILDEPASALDPVAEAEIYEKFNRLVEDKTAVYISHRMSSSMFCDRILILDGGRVADYDTHENLMKKTDNLYYKLFMSQAENYQMET